MNKITPFFGIYYSYYVNQSCAYSTHPIEFHYYIRPRSEKDYRFWCKWKEVLLLFLVKDNNTYKVVYKLIQPDDYKQLKNYEINTPYFLLVDDNGHVRDSISIKEAIYAKSKVFLDKFTVDFSKTEPFISFTGTEQELLSYNFIHYNRFDSDLIYTYHEICYQTKLIERISNLSTVDLLSILNEIDKSVERYDIEKIVDGLVFAEYDVHRSRPGNEDDWDWHVEITAIDKQNVELDEYLTKLIKPGEYLDGRFNGYFDKDNPKNEVILKKYFDTQKTTEIKNYILSNYSKQDHKDYLLHCNPLLKSAQNSLQKINRCYQIDIILSDNFRTLVDNHVENNGWNNYESITEYINKEISNKITYNYIRLRLSMF